MSDIDDNYLVVAEDLKRKAHALRVAAMSEPPRSAQAMRARAVKLQRAAHVLLEEGPEPAECPIDGLTPPHRRMLLGCSPA